MSAPAAWFDPTRLSADDPRPYIRIGPASVHPHFVVVCILLSDLGVDEPSRRIASFSCILVTLQCLREVVKGG